MTKKLSEVDQILIRYADTLSLNALSYKVEGLLTPEQCGARIATLLDAPDWLTAAQADQLVTLKMRQVVVQLEELPLTARTAEIILRGLESIGARLDKRQAATEKDLSTLYAFQGSVLLDAVEASLTHLRKALTHDIDPAKWDNAVESGLRSAQMVLATHDSANTDAEEEIVIMESDLREDDPTTKKTAPSRGRELPVPVIPTRVKARDQA